MDKTESPVFVSNFSVGSVMNYNRRNLAAGMLAAVVACVALGGCGSSGAPGAPGHWSAAQKATFKKAVSEQSCFIPAAERTMPYPVAMQFAQVTHDAPIPTPSRLKALLIRRYGVGTGTEVYKDAIAAAIASTCAPA